VFPPKWHYYRLILTQRGLETKDTHRNCTLVTTARLPKQVENAETMLLGYP